MHMSAEESQFKGGCENAAGWNSTGWNLAISAENIRRGKWLQSLSVVISVVSVLMVRMAAGGRRGLRKKERVSAFRSA
jgi:hypothetical protein